MRLILVGHMTVRIELGGVVLLTDPWFGPRGLLERLLAPRTVPPALTPDDIEHLSPGRPQAMLISHDHMDHMDDVALDLARWLGCAVIGSQRAARRARKAGVRVAVALKAGQEASVGGLTVHAVHAQHPLARDAVGFVLKSAAANDGPTVYFSGDTRFTPALAADLAPFAIDVALVQAACAHYPLLGDDGMSLAEAADLARTVRPGWTVPLHLHCAGKWLDRGAGVRIKKDNVAGVREALREWANRLTGEGLRVKLLEAGETWTVGEAPGVDACRADLG